MFHQRRTKKIAILEESPLFRGLSTRHLRLIEKHADHVAVAAGATVANPRQIPREFVAVHQGTLRAQSEAGALMLHAGDCFGELALLGRTPEAATVTAETPASLIVIEARSFNYLMEAIPALHDRIMGPTHGLENIEAA